MAELRLEQAKPQAIVQIMDLHGENAPTRLSITSHLQSEGCARAEARRDRAQDGRYKFDTKSKAPPPPKQGAIRGSGSTEMASPAGTPTGVPQQGVAGGGRGGAVGGGGGNGGTASARLPTSRGGARTHVDVVAAALRSRAGRLGYVLIPGAPLATRESRACQAERQGVGRCRPRRRLCASNLAALSAALSATLSARGLSAQLSAQLSAGFGGAGFRGGLLGRGLSGGNGRRRPRVTRQWLP